MSTEFLTVCAERQQALPTAPWKLRREVVMAMTQPRDERARLTRRHFLRTGAAIGAAAAAGDWGRAMAAMARAEQDRAPDMRLGASDLIVQPVLTYGIPRRREARSWRSWGAVQTEEALAQEEGRIGEELVGLSARAEFGLRTLPLLKLADPKAAAALKEADADVLLVYASGGSTSLLQALADCGKSLIIFVRQDSGPYYLWHEIVSARLLRKHTDRVVQPAVDEHDVVVDDPNEILWRLRALYGLSNTLGRRIVAVGGPGGWATPAAPELARERFQLDMVTVPVPELAAMIEAARRDESLMSQCTSDARRYLRPRDVTLHTTREAVAECFLLAKLFRDLMRKSDACAVTTRGCMGSYARIMPCLTLSLLNDAGYMAYCESDFVVIPSGILLHFISGRPTFLCNPTYPHDRRMLFAHCTAPRRMNGKALEAAKIVTHFESDHGATPKVAFRRRQRLTIIKPDFEAKHWLALKGRVARTPFLPVCRSQVEVKLAGETREAIENLRGFHCQIAYGDYTREVEYAAKKVGIQVQRLDPATA